ncbi:MAG: ASCH domain-containing protein [Flavobacteriales bacterium]
MKVLMSIKPEFASKIFDGSKRYEFRRMIFKQPAVKKVVVYASSPVQKVIGEFEIESILEHPPQELWDRTHEGAGISKDYFMAYFGDKGMGYAIRIKAAKRYRKPKCLKADYNLKPPQSYLYL